VGDHAYGRGGAPAGATRPFLHAYALRFTQPSTGAAVEVEAALPEDLRGVLATAGVPAPAVEDRPARPGDVEGAG
jgi:hypothetical protein